MKQVRLTKPNEAALEQIVKESKNDYLNVSKVANEAVEKGLPAVRKKHVKADGK